MFRFNHFVIWTQQNFTESGFLRTAAPLQWFLTINQLFRSFCDAGTQIKCTSNNFENLSMYSKLYLNLDYKQYWKKIVSSKCLEFFEDEDEKRSVMNFL